MEGEPSWGEPERETVSGWENRNEGAIAMQRTRVQDERSEVITWPAEESMEYVVGSMEKDVLSGNTELLRMIDH